MKLPKIEGLTSAQVKGFIDTGARLKAELYAREISDLDELVPGLIELTYGRMRRHTQLAEAESVIRKVKKAARKKRHRMTLAQRRAVSVRMKKYWADRRD
jgi:hypothetical protein